jgi:PAS domain S-box-containing protein
MEADAQSMEVVLEALRRSEQRYRSLVEATASFVWVARQDGALLSDMPRWRQITGQSVDELLGSGWLDAIHPDDRPGVLEAWTFAVDHATTYSVEYRIRHHEGGWRHLFVRGAPVFSETGEVREIIGLCIDVTDRAELAGALEQERSLLQTIIDQMPVAVAVVWGDDWIYRMANERYYEIVPVRRILGRPVREAVPEAYEAARGVLEPAYRGEPVTEDLHVEWETGKRHYRVSTTPVRGDDDIVAGVLIVAVETTDEVLARAGLEQRLEQERHTARTLQRALLPERLPAIPGLECEVRYQPGGGDLLVGGDFYEVLELEDDHRAGLVVGDVAGRGVRAAAVMGQLRAAVRAYAAEVPDDPAGVIARTSEFFWRFEPGEMATLAYGLADPRERLLDVAIAGHLPALVIEPDAEPRFAAVSQVPPLGATAERYRAERLGPLPQGTTVILYTDGLIERRGESIDAGLERLRQAAAGRAGDALGRLCDHLMAATGLDTVREDDLALLAVRFV